eukprot:c15832_g1_i1 orf=171-335(+)
MHWTVQNSTSSSLLMVCKAGVGCDGIPRQYQLLSSQFLVKASLCSWQAIPMSFW